MTKALGLSWLQLPVTVLLLTNPWHTLVANGQQCQDTACNNEEDCEYPCTCYTVTESAQGVCGSPDLEAPQQYQSASIGGLHETRYPAGGGYGHGVSSAQTGLEVAQSLTSELSGLASPMSYRMHAQPVQPTLQQPAPSSSSPTPTSTLPGTPSKPSGVSSSSAQPPTPPKLPGTTTSSSGLPKATPPRPGPGRLPLPLKKPPPRHIPRPQFRLGRRLLRGR
uniref:Putative receptor protein kinase perk1 n=1 Tax=Amblyomma cajennense TaxID=34607 RepID=A0A023FCZ3_AMBCJ